MKGLWSHTPKLILTPSSYTDYKVTCSASCMLRSCEYVSSNWRIARANVPRSTKGSILGAGWQSEAWRLPLSKLAVVNRSLALPAAVPHVNVGVTTSWADSPAARTPVDGANRHEAVQAPLERQTLAAWVTAKAHGHYVGRGFRFGGNVSLSFSAIQRSPLT